MKKISVIIPCYNAEMYIKDCLNSVFAQTYHDFEIICVNDGSTDHTLDILNQFKTDYPNIINVHSIENSGAPIARNVGFKISKGEFIQYLDSDDILMPDKFEKQLNGFHDDTDVVISDRVYKNQDLSITLQTFFFDEIQKKPLETAVKKIIITCNPLYRRKVVEELKGYDESLQSAQDWDFHLRMVLAGYKINYIPGIFLVNRKLSNSISSNWVKVSIQAAIVIEKLKTDLLKHPQMNESIRYYLAQVYLNNAIFTSDKVAFNKYMCELAFWAQRNYGFIQNRIKRISITLLGIDMVVKILRLLR